MYFNQNRFWTHRDQYSIDSDTRGFYLRRRHCIRPLLRVTGIRRSTKIVWVNQIDSEILWEHISELLSRGGLYRQNVFCLQRTLETSKTISLSRFVSGRSLVLIWGPPESLNSKKWVSYIKMKTWIWCREIIWTVLNRFRSFSDVILIKFL